MKVKELIEKLSKLDQEKEVKIESIYSENCLDITSVNIINDNVYIELNEEDFELNREMI